MMYQIDICGLTDLNDQPERTRFKACITHHYGHDKTEIIGSLTHVMNWLQARINEAVKIERDKWTKINNQSQ